MSEEKILTESELNSLFEDPVEIPETKDTNDVAENESAAETKESDLIAPKEFSGMENSISNEEVFGSENHTFDANDILNGMYETDEDGHTTGTMMASLSILHGVTNNTSIEDVPAENREPVEDLVVESAAFDLYSLDGHLVNMILTFDSPQDAYLKELYQLLNRYRMVQQDIATKGIETDVPMFTFTAMPRTLDGQGALSAMFPVAYFRVLNDNCENASLMMQFYEDTISFVALDISEEEKTDMIASVMREAETSGSGSMFEEE